MDQLKMPVPYDFHLHVRKGLRLISAVTWAAMHFGGAIIMPNTDPHIVTVEQARLYREEILAAVPEGKIFNPLMTLSLKPETTPEIVREAAACGFIHGFKLYAGHTTNSAGFENIKLFYPVLAEMEKQGVPLLVHGEAGAHVDVFDREEKFYKKTLRQIVRAFPKLRIVCEHITTRAAVAFVMDAPAHVVATITPQHLLANRNYMLGQGLRASAYCMPILKREEDRVALLEAAASGNLKFGAGTDSAPHPMFGESGKAKYASCGCAGSFTSPVAIAQYAEALDSVGKLHMLPGFMDALRGFYGLPLNEGQIVLTRQVVPSPTVLEFGETKVEVFRSEKPLQWLVERID